MTHESVSKHLGSAVEGTSVELSEDGGEMGEASEVHRIKKTYKITCAKGGRKEAKGINGDAGKKDDRSDIEAVILGTIALKGA